MMQELPQLNNAKTKDDDKPVKSTNKSNMDSKPVKSTKNESKPNDMTKSIKQQKSINKIPSIESKEEKDIIELSQPNEENKPEKKCCECYDPNIFRATMSIILFFIYWFAYLGDIITMLTLMIPQTGGGIRGCNCNSINIMTECTKCWNCIWPDIDTQKCIYFDSNIEKIQLLFLILFGYCCTGWLINEITVWIRVCIICQLYNKEHAKYRVRKEKQIDEFVKQNAGHLLRSKVRDNVNPNMTVHKQDTLIQYETDYDNDIMGLFPCCFEDIDEYHMKQILVLNTEQDAVLNVSGYQINDNISNIQKCCKFPADMSAKCYEFPLFMVGFSLSLCWLFPFRHFWELAICNLRSNIWKRACWFGVFHVILFDVCWIVLCWFIYTFMQDAKTKGINSYIDDLGPFLERKVYDSFAMSMVMVIIWLTIPLYAITNANHDTIYSPVMQVNDVK
eukprot:6408_1